MKLSTLLNDEELKDVKSIIIESRISYEPDPDKRYERLLARLKVTNPKLHNKILNID